MITAILREKHPRERERNEPKRTKRPSFCQSSLLPPHRSPKSTGCSSGWCPLVSRALLEGGGLRGAEAGFVAVSCGGETSEETSEKPFFTLDLAKRKDGGWIILEWGDGQVSGLPDRADVVVPFYEKIKLAIIGRLVTQLSAVCNRYAIYFLTHLEKSVKT